MIGTRVHGVGVARHGLLLGGEGWPGMFVHGDLAGRLRWFLVSTGGRPARFLPERNAALRSPLQERRRSAGIYGACNDD